MDDVKFSFNMILNILWELEEALLDQIFVEINDEKEMAELSLKIKGDSSFQ